jgi:hypothetical protein
LLPEEDGGMSIMLLSLIILGFCISVLAIALDFGQQLSTMHRLKQHVNLALHAASLSYDKLQLAEGIIALDLVTPGQRAQDQFVANLQNNVHLNSGLKALSNSYLEVGSKAEIHALLYADVNSGSLVNVIGTGTTMCALHAERITCNGKWHAGSSKEIARTVDELLVGPSLVAIIEVEHQGLGVLDNEPLIVIGVQEVRYRN